MSDAPRRRSVPRQYPEQLIMMATTEMAKRVTRLADRDGLPTSAELRLLIGDALDRREQAEADEAAQRRAEREARRAARQAS